MFDLVEGLHPAAALVLGVLSVTFLPLGMRSGFVRIAILRIGLERAAEGGEEPEGGAEPVELSLDQVIGLPEREPDDGAPLTRTKPTLDPDSIESLLALGVISWLFRLMPRTMIVLAVAALAACAVNLSMSLAEHAATEGGLTELLTPVLGLVLLVLIAIGLAPVSHRTPPFRLRAGATIGRDVIDTLRRLRSRISWLRHLLAGCLCFALWGVVGRLLVSASGAEGLEAVPRWLMILVSVAISYAMTFVAMSLSSRLDHVRLDLLAAAAGWDGGDVSGAESVSGSSPGSREAQEELSPEAAVEHPLDDPGMAHATSALGGGDASPRDELPDVRPAWPSCVSAQEIEGLVTSLTDESLDDCLDRAREHEARNEWEAALVCYLEVVGRKQDRSDEARKCMLRVFTSLGSEHSLTMEYRKRLASTLW
jgi:hypothetical protein